MSGNIGLKRSEELEDYLSFKHQCEYLCDICLKDGPDKYGIHDAWFYGKGALQHDPEDRAIAVMPLVIWEINHGYLTPEMEGELYGSKEDMDDGLLDGYPADMFETMKKDIEYCIEIYERDIEPKQRRED